MGFTQKELSEKTGLSERTIQRIENHEVKPSGYSLQKIGEVLNTNFNEQKLKATKRNNAILKGILIVISIGIVVEFLLGVLNIREDWWVLLCWFIPVLTGGGNLPSIQQTP